ncbi:hypothetical protein B296_00009046 [Ensete ventricosum]|uniref:Uncharacterized protein n=1 Tax=Ensete ventricosum TaxID=4639 RepID=A0A427AJT1_ENSVE|nr:hypothetical protein B296_00009046 [Ensete ventricosum]
MKSRNLTSSFVGVEQCTVCSTRWSSPRGWWSPKLPKGRIRRRKLIQEDRYPRGTSLGSPEGESCATIAHVEEYLKTTTPKSSTDRWKSSRQYNTCRRSLVKDLIIRRHDQKLSGAPFRLTAMDSNAMGLAALWYRKDGTSVESLIPSFIKGERWS